MEHRRSILFALVASLLLTGCATVGQIWKESEALPVPLRNCALNKSMFSEDWSWRTHNFADTSAPAPTSENNYLTLRVVSKVAGAYGVDKAYVEIYSQVEKHGVDIGLNALMSIPTPDMPGSRQFTPGIQRTGAIDQQVCRRQLASQTASSFECVLAGIYKHFQVKIVMLGPSRMTDSDIAAVLNPIITSISNCAEKLGE